MGCWWQQVAVTNTATVTSLHSGLSGAQPAALAIGAFPAVPVPGRAGSTQEPDGNRSWPEVLPCTGGGAALQLTMDPLDLYRPEHMAALLAAYDAFPAISRKDSPETHRVLLRSS